MIANVGSFLSRRLLSRRGTVGGALPSTPHLDSTTRPPGSQMCALTVCTRAVTYAVSLLGGCHCLSRVMIAVRACCARGPTCPAALSGRGVGVEPPIALVWRRLRSWLAALSGIEQRLSGSLGALRRWKTSPDAASKTRARIEGGQIRPKRPSASRLRIWSGRHSPDGVRSGARRPPS
jgi:hypothetical protein